MFDFHRPWLFALLPLLLAGVLLVRVRAPRGVSLGDLTGAMPAARSARWLAGFGTVARLGVLSLLVAVMAGPYSRGMRPGPPSEGVAIVIALDVSESMRDGRLGGATRLDAALDELERFIGGRERDAIGLVTFAGEAVGRVPPVQDRRPLEAAVSAIRAESPSDGTALGTAIGVAANRLRAVDARSKIVVAITDGESNAGAIDPVTASEAAAALGIRTYTIGVGQGADDALERVAEVGRGRHFLVTDLSGLDRAYGDIDAIESIDAGPGEPIQLPRHASLLWVAAFLLAAEGGVRAGRSGGVP